MTAPGRTLYARLFPQKRGSRKNARGPIEGLKTLGFVVPLTILIWVYAERAQTRSEELKVRVGFNTPTADTAATVTDPSDWVSLTLEGPSGQIEQFKRNVNDASRDGRLWLPVPAGDKSLGRKTIMLSGAVRNDPRFSSLNLSVVSSPPDVHATVDPIISRDVAVGPPQGLQVNLQNPTFDPQRITVTGPQTLVNNEFGGETPTIAVDANSVDLTPGNGPRKKLVSLIRPRESGVTLSQQQITMTYEVGSTIRDGEIRTVYIDVRRPVAEDGRSKVIMRGGPVIHNVQISGPANVVSRLIGDSPERSVKAVLPITKEDVDKGELRRAVDLDLKDGVTPMGGPYEVTFEVRGVTGDQDR